LIAAAAEIQVILPNLPAVAGRGKRADMRRCRFSLAAGCHNLRSGAVAP